MKPHFLILYLLPRYEHLNLFFIIHINSVKCFKFAHFKFQILRMNSC